MRKHAIITNPSSIIESCVITENNSQSLLSFLETENSAEYTFMAVTLENLAKYWSKLNFGGDIYTDLWLKLLEGEPKAMQTAWMLEKEYEMEEIAHETK